MRSSPDVAFKNRDRAVRLLPRRYIDDRFSELVGVPRAFGVAHLPGPLRDNCCSASKLSAALWSKTSARCLAFSSGHVSTVDSVPSGAIRTTCHPMGLASYRSRFILRICAPTRSFSSPEVCHIQTDPLPREGSGRPLIARNAWPDRCGVGQ